MANDALIQGRIGVDLGGPQKEAPAGYRVIFDFSAGNDCLADLSYLSEQGFISGWQSMYVDNSGNAADVTFTFAGTDQVITVKAGLQKYINILASTPFSVNANSTGGVRVIVFFLNFPVQNSLGLEASVAGIVETVPAGGPFTDRSAAATGVDQVLMTANIARHHLVIFNPAATQLGINLTGGAAVIGGAGTIVLNQYGSIDLDNYPPTNAIHAIGTAAAEIVAFEG